MWGLQSPFPLRRSSSFGQLVGEQKLILGQWLSLVLPSGSDIDDDHRQSRYRQTDAVDEDTFRRGSQ